MKSGSEFYSLKQSAFHQEAVVYPRFELLSNLELNLEPMGTLADTIQIGLLVTDGDADGTEYVNVRVIIETTRDADYNLVYN